ncbi:MAG TPA: PAS domain-containing protein, partial [Nitrospiria bacterium]|nr:PAS domain-containing protein [Nitrospiria bacterium]
MKTRTINVLSIGAYKLGEKGLYAALRKERLLKIFHCSDIPVQESLLVEKRPDIVLVDLVRRDFSVLEIFKMIQSMALHVPVIYLGNLSQIDQIKKGKKKSEEIIAIIKKGLNSDLLARIIQYEFYLTQKERDLAEVQNLTHIGSWNFDLASNRLTWSVEHFKIFGYESENAKPTFDLFINAVHPEDKERVIKFIERAKSDRQPCEFAFRIIRPDGSVRFIQFHTHLATDWTGQVVRMYGTAQDITEQNLSDEKLNQQTNLMMSILKETSDTIFIKDLNGKYLIVNEIGAANFNKTPEELIGHDNSILNMPDEAARKIEESDRQVIRSGENQNYEIELMIKGEKRFYLSTKGPY